MCNTEHAKFKIGEKVIATWTGGHETEHVVLNVSKELHGNWYTFRDENNVLSGTYEIYLRKCHNE
jgi:hypothetical protein